MVSSWEAGPDTWREGQFQPRGFVEALGSLLRRNSLMIRMTSLACAFAVVICCGQLSAEEKLRDYENQLKPIDDPKPLLADHPEFLDPIREVGRFEAPLLVNDEGADLEVRAWRFSYNARGIIEMPNRLRAAETALIVVHPWGIDDGQGWDTPEPAGVADFCTPQKNHLAAEHTRG